MTLGKLATVQEVCEILQIKRPRAYELARLWEQSHGKEGLPCIRLGTRQLRFSFAAIEEYLRGSSETKEHREEVRLWKTH